MERQSVLIIEDDDQLASALAPLLEGLGFTVERRADGLSGLELAVENAFALIVLDINLPSLEGVEVCRRIREKDARTPIIMLTGNTDELSKVLLLELGADDYITKPFSASELKARIKAVLRRASRSGIEASESDTSVYRFKDIEIDLARCIVRREDKEVPVTASEFEILQILLSRPGHPFSKDLVTDKLYGSPEAGYTQSIGSHISRMRVKLESDPANPEFLLTVRGLGYKVAEADRL